MRRELTLLIVTLRRFFPFRLLSVFCGTNIWSTNNLKYLILYDQHASIPISGGVEAVSASTLGTDVTAALIAAMVPMKSAVRIHSYSLHFMTVLRK